jgi:hypothetical protein
MEPVTTVAAATAAANFLGGLWSNKSNKREAQKDRQFQERMRNTQWQAAVADMRAAGLNPALAYSQGPNAAPGGAMATTSNPVEGAVSSGMQVKMQSEQLKLIRQQQQAAMAQTIKTRSDARSVQLDNDMKEARWSMYFQRDPKNPGKYQFTQRMRELLNSEHAATMANNARNVTELDLARFRVPEMQALAKLFENAGAGGKGMQMLLPLIISMIRR